MEPELLKCDVLFRHVFVWSISTLVKRKGSIYAAVRAVAMWQPCVESATALHMQTSATKGFKSEI